MPSKLAKLHQNRCVKSERTFCVPDICELNLGEVGEHAKQGMWREFVRAYRDRLDVWLKVGLHLEDGAQVKKPVPVPELDTAEKEGGASLKKVATGEGEAV